MGFSEKDILNLLSLLLTVQTNVHARYFATFLITSSVMLVNEFCQIY